MMMSYQRCLVAAALLAVGSMSTTTHAQNSAESADTFSWMASEVPQDSIYHQVHQGRPDLATITGTSLPKATSNDAEFTREYVLELERFNIHNDGTHPVETSRGINQALAYAKTIHINRIVFPQGTYCISEDNPIILDHQNTVIDLNQATLQINTNGLKRYSIINIVPPARNLRLTNGHIRGDRDTHDFKTIKATHEHGMGLTVAGGSELEIDHLTITNVTGSGVSTRIHTGGGTRQFKWVTTKDLQSGKLSDEGQIIPSDDQLITTDMYDISSAIHGFEFGYTLGYQSYQSIKARLFTAAFYDENRNFMEARPCLQFKKESIPEGAKFIRLQFNQATAKNASEGMVGRITDLDFPAHVHFHHNLMNNNRTLGLAFCGGQNWIIEHNRFENNGGNAPGFGVDFEDGWDLMREIIFRHNTFEGNKAGDLVVCAGTEMIFSDNQFVNNVIFQDRANNYEFTRNTVTSGMVLFKTGIKHAVIHHNTYSQVNLQIRWNLNHWPDVPPLRLTSETLLDLKGLSGNHLVFDQCTIRNTSVTLRATSRLLALRNCQIENFAITQTKAAKAPEVSIESSRIIATTQPLLDADIIGFGTVRLTDNQIENLSDTSLIKLKLEGKCDTTPQLEMRNNRIHQKADTPVIAADAAALDQLKLDEAQTITNQPLTRKTESRR